jgi:tRNA U54 and U55 pseudouridine synthase Pus10
VIGQTDLVLGRIPEEIAEERRQYYSDQTAGQNESIEQELKREAHKVAPIQRTLKQTQSGGPRKAAFGE